MMTGSLLICIPPPTRPQFLPSLGKILNFIGLYTYKIGFDKISGFQITTSILRILHSNFTFKRHFDHEKIQLVHTKCVKPVILVYLRPPKHCHITLFLFVCLPWNKAFLCLYLTA